MHKRVFTNRYVIKNYCTKLFKLLEMFSVKHHRQYSRVSYKLRFYKECTYNVCKRSVKYINLRMIFENSNAVRCGIYNIIWK